MTKETRQFQAEVKEILDLMVHSLYSQREIFLRELISNASDAIDKLRFEELSHPEWPSVSEEKHIRIEADAKARTLTLKDNGIGMTYDEVLANIGTIAHSGTKDFIAKAKEAKNHPELIGQFGVGFYSSFMVADKVTVHTHRAGTDEAVIWESKGDGEYTIERKPRPDGVGTSITLHLKAQSDEDDAQDFTDQFTLKTVVKKYSDFIEFPIKMLTSREEPELDKDGKPVEGKFKTVTEDETLNSMQAIWLRSSTEIKDEEYKEFYKHVGKDWADPLNWLHYKAEGMQEFSALIYLPSQVPFDYNYRDSKWGLSLYVNRVFIMDHCEDLLPSYLRFAKGVIDSSDLSLNVSREILQKDRQIQAIKKAITKRLIKHLGTMLADERDTYQKFWEQFGATLKEGITSDFANKEKLEQLCLFHSSHASEAMTTLDEYVSRMKKDQTEIYYIAGDSIKQIQSSPYLEKLKEKDYEVLYCIDPVDEWVMQSMPKYKDHQLRSITKEGLDLDSEEEKEAKKKDLETKEKEFSGLIKTIQGAVADHIKEVKISSRLVDSPCCLVSGAYDPSARMERMMSAMGQSMPKAKRIMEINPEHPVLAKMKQLPEDSQKKWAEILYNQALLNEGSQIEDPLKFTKMISELMETSASV